MKPIELILQSNLTTGTLYGKAHQGGKKLDKHSTILSARQTTERAEAEKRGSRGTCLQSKCAANSGGNRDGVDSELELKEAGDSGVHVASPPHRTHDARKVVVHEQDVGGVLGNRGPCLRKET